MSELQTGICWEYTCKILTMIQVKQIQQPIKGVIYHNQVGLILERQSWFNI
jgi:hypothetical protein